VDCDHLPGNGGRLVFFENNFTISYPGVFALCRPQQYGSISKGTPEILAGMGRGIEKEVFGVQKL